MALLKDIVTHVKKSLETGLTERKMRKKIFHFKKIIKNLNYIQSLVWRDFVLFFAVQRRAMQCSHFS